MKVAQYYSHLNGLEFLKVHKPHLWDEITHIVESIDAESCRTKVSKEVRMKGKVLYSPKDMNAAMKILFNDHMWAESRTGYWVTDDARLIRKTLHLSPDAQKKEIEATGRTPLYSYNQTDYVKDRIAVEVQFGKYAFVAFDLFVKHMAFYIGDVIDVGIEIVPMKTMQSQMSSGPAHYEGALYDLIREGRGVPAVPLVLIGVAP